MYGSRIVSGLAAVFGGTTVLFAVLGVVYSPALLVVAALFGAVTYFVWYHASGRFARRLYRGVEERARVDDERAGFGPGPRERGGFGAGPREEWTPPREKQRRARATADGRGRRAGQQRGRRRSERRPGGVPDDRSGPTAAEAYRTLGLDRDADAEAVRAAYREKVKEVHPDSEDGDEETFKEVQAAYERLTDD